MKKSIDALATILDALSRRARHRALNDSVWAARAGVRKETLSRLKNRPSCDFSTLQSLAHAVGAGIGLSADERVASTSDGLFPAHLDRKYEEDLSELCGSADLRVERWREAGPAFFMAGLAVMMASVPGFDRRGLLELAERLHRGSSQAGVFSLWLAGSPIEPSRFLPPLAAPRSAT